MQLKNLLEEKFKQSYFTEQSIEDAWVKATFYHRLQNRLLKEGEKEKRVWETSLFDEETQRIKLFTVRAKVNLNRHQWFILISAEDFLLSVQKLREIICIDGKKLLPLHKQHTQ